MRKKFLVSKCHHKVIAKYNNIGLIKLVGDYKNKGIATFNYPFNKVALNT